MRYKQLLEHYINLFTPEEKYKYASQVWDLLQLSYAYAGGFKTAASIDELIAKSGLWKLNIRDGHIYTAFIYKDKLGRKTIALGTDGSDRGKDDLLKIQSDDIMMNRSWVEVSGSVERIMIKYNAIPISNKFASILINKEILSYNDDGFHYTRLIAGHPHEKIIYGFVELNKEVLGNLLDSGIAISDIPSNIHLPNLS